MQPLFQSYFQFNPINNRLSQSLEKTFLNDLRVFRLYKWIMSAKKTKITRKTNDHLLEEDSRAEKKIVYNLRNPNVTHLYRTTIQNMKEMVRLTTEKRINFIFVQYALRKANLFENNFDRYVISNYEFFTDVLKRYTYDELFIDKFAEDFGHATPFGNRIIAENVARQLLKFIETQEQPS